MTILLDGTKRRHMKHGNMHNGSLLFLFLQANVPDLYRPSQCQVFFWEVILESRRFGRFGDFGYFHRKSNITVHTHNRHANPPDKQHWSRPQTTTSIKSGYTNRGIQSTV